MADDILTTLSQIIARRGPSVLADYRLLNAILRDLHPDAPLKISVLVELIRSDLLPTMRETTAATSSTDAALVTHLKEQAGISPRHGAWAIDGWRKVLHLSSTSTNEPAPTSQGGVRSLISSRPGSLDDVLHIQPPTQPRDPG